MSSNFLAPNLKQNGTINEELLTLIKNIKNSGSPSKIKNALLSYYQNNSSDTKLNNCLKLLGYEPKNSSFKNQLNKNKVLEILTKEYNLTGLINDQMEENENETHLNENINKEKKIESSPTERKYKKTKLGRKRKGPKSNLANGDNKNENAITNIFTITSHNQTKENEELSKEEEEFSNSSDNSQQNNPNNQLNSSDAPNVFSISKHNKQNSRNTAFGLKEISKRVMEIIKHNGQTTYREISDQIVNEINEKSIKDEKNIRRRIYDSLNVMKSMKLFKKDKKDKTIKWNYDKEYDPLNEMDEREEDDNQNQLDNVGRNEYRNNSNQINDLKKENKVKKEKINLLTQELRGLKNVLERNKRENENIAENKKIYFPFLIIEFPTNKDPKVNVALNESKTSAHIGFDEADALYGDLDCVSKIGNQPDFSKDNENDKV